MVDPARVAAIGYSSLAALSLNMARQEVNLKGAAAAAGVRAGENGAGQRPPHSAAETERILTEARAGDESQRDLVSNQGFSVGME